MLDRQCVWFLNIFKARARESPKQSSLGQLYSIMGLTQVTVLNGRSCPFSLGLRYGSHIFNGNFMVS